MASSALFQPTRVGLLDLQHRVSMAPLTRYRVEDGHVPMDWMVEHYAQRASVPGTLLIAEATLITPEAGTYAHAPGVWSDEQLSQWKKVTDAVHEKKSFIYLQLWALGREADYEQLKKELPDADFVSSGDIPTKEGGPKPRPLTVSEIDGYVSWFATAAHNSVHRAGFDGVEIHAANGYLIEQFMQDVINNRTDEYGGSIENRNRFGLRIVDAVVKAVGAERTGIRLSPYEIPHMEDPIPTYSHFISELTKYNISYVHIINRRTAPTQGSPAAYHDDSIQFARDIWAPRPLLVAGGLSPESGIKIADEGAAKGENIIAVYGRHFLSNPDLPLRIKNNIPLNPYDRTTFFTPKNAKGYNDYPFVSAEIA